jgi:[lysine-biosynthesis-protein LysW]--L-2-aminoadipate ligase
MHIALLASRIRVEEKLLIEAMERRGIDYSLVDDREVVLDLAHPDPQWFEYDAVICRTLSQSRGLMLTYILENWGLRVVNSAKVVATCNDKVLTTLALLRAGVPTPRTLVAFEQQSGTRAIEVAGYPAVLKPIVGSWGRLVARVCDRDGAEALLEHQEVLGSYQHHIHYVQEHITKPDRDIRAFVVGHRTICVTYRTSKHWITNNARGAIAINCPSTPELDDLCVRAGEAVGGGILAIDLLEDPKRGYLVHEVNATMEFRNSIAPTGVDIPGLMIDYTASMIMEGGAE